MYPIATAKLTIAHRTALAGHFIGLGALLQTHLLLTRQLSFGGAVTRGAVILVPRFIEEERVLIQATAHAHRAALAHWSLHPCAVFKEAN